MVQLNVIESKFPWGLLFGIFGRGVVPELPRSPNPGPILDQMCQLPHRFSDLASQILIRFQA